MKSEVTLYRIRIGAHLDQEWSEWFEGMKVSYAKNGDTLLTGAVKDQAMLYGVLTKLYNFCLPLISLMRLPDQIKGDLSTNISSPTKGTELET